MQANPISPDTQPAHVRSPPGLQVWNTLDVLNVLQALVDKSNIVQVRACQGAGGARWRGGKLAVPHAPASRPRLGAPITQLRLLHVAARRSWAWMVAPCCAVTRASSPGRAMCCACW